MTERDDHLVLIGWNDLAGLTRLRGLPHRLLESAWRDGLGWAAAGHAITPFGGLVDNPWGPVDEVRQIPDPNARLWVPASHGQPPLELYLASSRTAAEEPWDCCPRSFCDAMLKALRAQTGLHLRTAFEYEFTLMGDATPFAPAPVYTLEATRIAQPVLQDCVDALNATGADLQTYEAEFGVGQYEFSFGPADGLCGADRGVLTRETVREVARRRGLRASFTAKPAPDAVGNGGHVHFSLVDSAGAPASYRPDGPGLLSEVGAHFVAGVFDHLAGLTALCAPAPVSYLRLGPGHWSCGYASLGLQNREAALRICPPPSRESAAHGRSHNIELRIPDGLSNPYLVVGAIAAAGLDGIRRRQPLPQLVTTDPAALSDRERAKLGIVPLPVSLEAALAALHVDSVLSKDIPATMLRVFDAIKRSEIEHVRGMSPAQLCDAYVRVY